ncbi:MAG: regulatory protein RecX [Spirochaetaceae bacterium]|nr:regulatory protein RecX [Spirochaetaceae bacterium]
MDGFTVTPEESSPFFVPNYLLENYPNLELYSGDEINQDGYDFLYSLHRIYLCQKKSIDLLSRREHSSFELTNKLKQRKFSQSEIDQTLTYLKKKNFLNDTRFTEFFILSRLRKKPEGMAMIVQRLLQKGISYSISQEIYSNIVDDEMQKDIIQKAYEKTRLKYSDNQEKLINYLLRIGFTYSDIKRVIDDNSDN